MLKRVVMTGIILISALSFLMALGHGDKGEFPESGLRIIVPYAEGGGTDAIARALAPALASVLGQPVHVENRLGGSGAVGMIAGAAAVPDGYTMTMITREAVSLPALGLAEIARDDFSLLGLVNKEPAVLVVSSDSPFHSLDELLKAASSMQGKIRFASAAKPHFYILELESRMGVMFSKIPYNGAAKAIPAVVEGKADFTLANPGELKNWTDQGQIRALGIMDEVRASGMDTIPTFKELGIDIESYTWRGLAVPAGTSPDIRRILEEAVAEACGDRQFIRQMAEAQYNLHYMNANDFDGFIRRDEETIKEIIKTMMAF